MATSRKSKNIVDARALAEELAGAMPSEAIPDDPAPDDILSQWPLADAGSWATALDALAPAMSQAQLNSALRLVLGQAGRYLEQDYSGALLRAQALMEKGADPFAKIDEESAKERWAHKRSFFGALVKDGYWAYAAKLAEDPGVREKCRQEIIHASMPHALRDEPNETEHAYRMLADGGVQGFKLGFLAGMGPNDLARGKPWFFLCDSKKTLEACIEAGADLSLTGRDMYWSGEKSFEEILCSRGGERIGNAERSGMLALIRAQGSKMDPEAGGRALEGLIASHGSWADVKKVQKAYGIHASTAKSAGGLGMLEISLAAGNWQAASELMADGADPMSISKNTGLPVIAQALWTPASSPRAKGGYFENAAARAKREAAERKVLEAIDFEWEDDSGRLLLESVEAFLKKKAPTSGPTKYAPAAMQQMIKACKLSAEAPLWRRLIDAGADMEWARLAATSRDEPWMCADGIGMLFALVRARVLGNARWADSWRASDDLERFISTIKQKKSDVAREQAKNLFSPEQWRSAWDLWGGQVCSGSRDWESLSSGFVRAMECQAELAKFSSVDAGEIFDAGVMGKIFASAWTSMCPKAHLRSATLEGAKAISLACPDHGSMIIMDVLATQTEAAMDAAAAAWGDVKSSKKFARVPIEHRLFTEPGAVGEALACHPFWRALEERVVEEACSPRAAKPRMQ